MSLGRTPESQVLAALEVFSSATDKDAIDRANSWLLDFQHSTEAWSTANNLLLAPDTLPHARLFAAQTFRAKVIYDLTQIPSTQYIPLRDTLITAMHSISQSGPKTVITQLCLALSGLALQTPLLDIIDVMLKTFGQTPEGVAVLLEFLTVFPEELSENTRIPVSPEEYRERMSKLLTDHASKILDLLTVYIQSPAATLVIQNQIFKCLRSWLNTGQVMAVSIGETPLLPFAFEALSSDELFDSAVDVICDIIHETQEIEENMSVIHAVVPRVIALKPLLRTYHDDAEKIKGFSKIFAEAGETYRVLLLQNSQDFLPILEAIVECTAYSDLDIVPMTFSFWWRLSQSIGKRSSVPPVLIEVYSTLVDIIIKHLHFPTDPTSMSAQETDDFRSFRHVMGDTLKDCCHVLGTDKCLVRAYEMIVANLAADKGWQAIEAPLFSMRSMGAEMDPLDDQIIPKIMDLLPQLPHHPRVRYAALLVVSRYTEWTSHHPSYIPFQLQYISAGFDEANSAPDAEVPAAAGLAMKYLCKDCRQHLVSYIPQLHSFLGTIGTKLNHEDQLQIYEAVAYVISSMPIREATQTLHTFCTGVLAKIHLIVNKPTLATKDELQTLSNSLEHLETMLYVVKGFGDELPQDCQKTCQEAWSLFDTLLSKYGDSTIICDRATRVLRHGIDLCGTAALPIVPQVLSRMTTSFGAWGHAGYVWIAGKVMARFGTDADETLRQIFRQAYEGLTSKLFTLMQTVLPMNMPDVIEDYVRMTLQMFDFTPDILLLSPQFPTSFAASTAGLALVQPEINYVCLDFIRAVVSHDSLRVPPPGEVTPSNHPLYAQAIRATFAAQGSQLLGFLLSGLVTEFDEDACPIVIAIFRTIAGVWPTELVTWLPPIVQQLPSSIPANEFIVKRFGQRQNCTSRPSSSLKAYKSKEDKYIEVNGDHLHRLVEVTLGEKITSLPNSITFAVERLAEAAAVLELEDPSMLAFKSAINHVSEDNLQLRSILIYLTGLEQDLAHSTEKLKEDMAFIQSYIATGGQAMLDKSALEKDKRAIVVKAQEYQEELKKLSSRRNDDASITALMALQARVRAKEKDVKTLKIRLEAFHGLPPNLDLARNQLRIASEEHLRLLNTRDMLLEKMNVGLQ